MATTATAATTTSTTDATLDPLALRGLNTSVGCGAEDGSGWPPAAGQDEPQPVPEPATGLSVPGVPSFDATLPPVPVTVAGTKHYVAVLRCGDGWYPASDALVVVSPGPRVAAQVQLPATGYPAERAVVERVGPGDTGATVRWRVTSGCCEDLTEYEADLVPDAAGDLVLTDPRALVRAQTLDVSRFSGAAFRHPAGHVDCQLLAAAETLPARAECTVGGSDRLVQAARSVCDPVYGGIVGLSAGDVSGFICGGDVLVWPVISYPSANWWLSAELPSLPGPGGLAAVLPVGVTLTHRDVSCTSDAEGVRCANAASGAAIRISADGSQFQLEGNVDPVAAAWAE